jgi:hypothetical protein
MSLDKNRTVAFLLAAVVTAVLISAVAMAADSAGDSAEKGAKRGFPVDWSSHHVIVTGSTTSGALQAGVSDPRHVYNQVRRMVAVRNAKLNRTREREEERPRRRRRLPKVDWSVSLENGFVPANQFPAKFRFDVSSEDCNGDFVLFGLTVNTGTQANLVGINNLYTEASPACNNGSPWVAFGYNTVTHTGGQIRTSPVLSVDGTMAAFVESANGGSYFHVIVLPQPMPAPGSQTGNVRNPATPGSCGTPTVVNCMTTLFISGAANTVSSPWVDYNTDTAYVGTDDGNLYKISPVFGGGAPTLTNNTDWPVSVVPTGSTSNVLTGPVVDTNAGRIFIGDANGYLYAISLSSPAKTTSARVSIGWVGHGSGTGVVDPPIVVNDSSNPALDQVFSFTGCSNIVGIGGAVNQIPANFTSTTAYTSVDLGSRSGTGDCTTGNVHGGTFDDAFWTGGSATGHIIACGFVTGTTGTPLAPSNPKMYKIGFDVNHLITPTGSATWVVNNTKGDECSPLTEFSNGTMDKLFFGVGKAGGSGDGFVESSSFTAGFPAPGTCSAGSPTSTCVTAPKALGGTSGIIVDNMLSNGGTNIYFSTLAGGSVNGQNCKVSGGVNTPFCAVKLTQSGLQ